MDGSRGRGGPAPTRVRGWAGRYGMALAVTGAAAILQAVDNLERERRRDEAKDRARAKTAVEKDW